MDRKELSEYLVGKVIASVQMGEYLHWENVIYSIEFTDGTVIELSGNADCAFVEVAE